MVIHHWGTLEAKKLNLIVDTKSYSCPLINIEVMLTPNDCQDKYLL